MNSRSTSWPPGRPTAECIGFARISMESPLTPEQRLHVSTCETCQQVIAQAAQEREERRQHSLPPGLKAAYANAVVRRRQRFAWTLIPVAAFGLATVLLTLHTPPQGSMQDGILAKGQVAIVAVVQRHGEDPREVDLDQVGPLQVDDVLRLRVDGKADGPACLQAFANDAWETVFRGVLPANRFFPGDFKVTEAPIGRVRATVCDRTATLDQACGQSPPASCRRVEVTR